MTNNIPSGAEKHREIPNQKVARRPKWSSSSSSSSSSDGLVQNLHYSFMMVFAQKQQHFLLSSALAHRFYPSLKSHKAVQTAH